MLSNMFAFSIGASLLPFVSSTVLQHRSPTSSDAPDGNDTQLLFPPFLAPDFPNMTTSVTTSNAPRLELEEPKCNRGLGADLNISSCSKAYNHMIRWLAALPRDKVSVGLRGEGVWDVGEIMSFVSGE